MKKLLLFLTLIIAGFTANAQFSPSNNLNYIKLLKTPPSGLPKDSVLVFDSSDGFVKMRPSSTLITKASPTKFGIVKTDILETDPIVYTKTTLDPKIDVKVENSAGAIEGFAITNNGDGTVNIATGTAYLRTTNNPYSPLIKYVIPAVTNLALMDNANNFVLVDYNGGSPALTVTIAPGTINTTTNSIAYLISRVGTTLDYINLVGQNVDANGKLRRRFLNSESLRRASGVVLTASNRNLLLTAGLFYSGLIEATTPAFNTSTGSTFTQAYLNGSTWVRTTGNTQINNTQYSLAGVLTTMPSNDYRVDYVYTLADNPSKLYVLLGTATYNNITNARLAPVPVDLPTELQYLGARVGRVIIQKDATTTETTSEFATIYQAGTAQLHNDLGGLNLGDFQHLTVAEKANNELKTNKQNSLTPDGTGTKYATVDAINAALPTTYTNIVYVNATSPTTATIFDLNNPPVTNDNALKTDVNNLYIGTDASTWVYITSPAGYVTKVIPASSNFFISGTTTDAGNNKTANIARTGGLIIGATTNSLAKLNVTGSVNSASLVARGVHFNPTLVATANNDVLVGLDLTPTFTNGAFTGVTNFTLRSMGIVSFSAVRATNIAFGNLANGNILNGMDGGIGHIRFYTNASQRAQFFSSTGNFTLQNGGTFTDAGFRLDVNGTTRLQADVTLLTSPTTSAGTYDFLTRNTSTGIVEKATSASVAPTASPIFTGNPTAPTPTLGDNDTSVATTAFVIANAGSGGSVNVVKNVWVSSTGNDSTALIGRQDLPFLTINSALIALGANGGIVNIGIGTFNSPTYTNIYPNTVFKGSGKPKYNNVVTGGSSYPLYTKTTATALIGGTILNGTFKIPLNGDSIHILDLGVDVGLVWCTDFNSGIAIDALTIPNDDLSNTTQVGKAFRKNIILKNISTIVKGPTDLFHGVDIENCYEPYVDNIDTYNGFAGFVYKNIGGTATNIKSSNSSTFGIVIKTNTYASNNSTFLNGFEIDGGAGLTIQDEGDASGIQNVYISNGRIRNTSFGVNQIGTLLKYINISNVHCSNISGFGFDFSGIQFSNFLNNSATSCTSGGFKIIGTNNRLSENRASYNTGVGIDLRTSSGTYPSISTGNDSSNNSTYGFSYSGDIRGGHNVAISNTTSAINGAITILDAPAPYVLPNPLSLSGAPGGYTPVLSVENTGTASVADKNVVIFKGNFGSDTSVDSNTTVGIWQKNNTVKNYGLISFFNSAGNTSAQLAVRNISQNVSQGSMAIITSTGGVLTPTLVAASSTNVLIGKDEFTGATNNDTGEKLQVVGTASITGVIKAGAPIRIKNYTVATLPTGIQGDTAYVTDATAPTYLGALTGGGSVVCPVFYNGTIWVSH